MNINHQNKFSVLLTKKYCLLILYCLLSLSVNANDLWTRYQFSNLEIPLPSFVNSLYEDRLGQIWVGSNSGLYRINNNKIQKVSHGPKSTIEHIYQAEADDIWLASTDGVWRWQSQTNNFSALNCPVEQSFSQLVAHPSLGLLALARSGVYQFKESQVCQKLSFEGMPKGAMVERIAMFNQNLMLAIRDQGLFHCLGDCNYVQSFTPELTNTRIREIVAFNNTLYAGTHKHGFFELNNQGEVQQNWHRNADSEPYDFTLPVNGVMTILPNEDSIWAGLWAGGLQQFETKSGRKISSSHFYASDSTTIGGNHVSALMKSKNGTLYIGHENGVSIILPENNQQGWIGIANDYQVGLSNGNVYSLFYINDSWLTGTSSGGLYLIGNNNNILSLSPDSVAPLDFPTKSIWQITSSNQGDLLLGTAIGVVRLNPNTLEWQLFGDSEKLESADVYRLTEAPDQTLWLSLWEGGIARLDQDGQLIGQWSHDDGLKHNTSKGLLSTSDNQIFALNNAGLFRYDNDLDRFVTSKLQNLQNQCALIDHISTDLTGQLWALCEHNSLWRLQQDTWVNSQLPTTEPILHIFSPYKNYQPNNEQLYLMSKNYVFAIDETGQLIWQKSRLSMNENVNIRQPAIVNNELVSATNKGLYRQVLNQTYTNTLQSVPIISGIRLFNKPLALTDKDSISRQFNDRTALYEGHLQLNYDQDLITFEFAMPGFHHEPVQGFKYRLLPFDPRWLKTAEDESKASYTRLPPGSYQFEAKAIVENELPPAIFEIEILPPWYLTLWSKTLALIAAIASVLAIIIARTRRLKQSNLWLKKNVEARTAELELANNKLQQAANLDVLTGLLNRRGFLKLCDPNWKQWQGKSILMIADIDHFKLVNDQYGHQIGDEVLVTCAQRLMSQASEHDLISRWGGEEFLILLRDDPISSNENLKLRAHLMREIISDTVMELNSKKISITMTAGMCIHHGESFDQCLQNADQKLYQGKKSGRNRLID